MDLPTFRETYRSGPSLEANNALLLAFAEDSMQVHPEELTPLLEQARADSHQAGLDLDVAYCNRLLGWIAFDRADYTSAEELFHQATEVFRRRSHLDGLVKSLNGIASVHMAQGNLEPGLEVFREALALAENLEDRSQAMVLQSNMGQTLVDLGQFDEALDLLTVAIDSGLLSPLNQSLVLTQWARASLGLGKDDQAREALLRSIGLARHGQFGSTLAVSLCLLGTLEIRANPGPLVDTLLEEARQVAAKVDDRLTEVQAILGLGQWRVAQGNPSEALGLFRTAIEQARAIGAQLLEAEALKGQTEVAKDLGLWQDAYHALERFQRISDRIHGEAVSKQLTQIRADQSRRETEILREQTRVLALLGDLGQKITASLDLESVITTVYQSIGGLMAAETFGLGLYDEEQQTIDFRLFIEDGKLLPAFQAPMEAETLSGWCIRHQQSLLINDVAKEYSRYIKGPPGQFGDRSRPSRSCLYTPLLASGKVLGVLSAQSTKPGVYTERDQATLRTLAASITIAVENARLFEKVSQLAIVDPLTGTATRRHLFDRLEQEFQRFKRDGFPLSLVMIDLDHFKRLNDTWGHATGDLVLAAFGRLCLNGKRPQDLLGRYGGEEFAMVLAGTTLEGALTAAHRLCQKVRDLTLEAPTGEALCLTASFGVTTFESSDEDISKVFSRADEALYEAKRAGRDRVVARTA